MNVETTQVTARTGADIETVIQNEVQREVMIREVIQKLSKFGKPIVIEGGSAISSDYIPGLSDRDVNVFIEGLTSEQATEVNSLP